MTLDSEILDNMLNETNCSISFLITCGFKFWISKEYTKYPNQHHCFDVIQTQLLNQDTILLCSEEQFLKYNLN